MFGADVSDGDFEMTEQAARSLAAVLGGEAIFPAPASRNWGVVVPRSDGRTAVIEDHAGWVYRDRTGYETYQKTGDDANVMEAQEWGDWDGAERWARGLSLVLGSKEYRHSGGGIWLAFHERPDGRYSVIGAESGGVYASREEFESDEFGEKGESHYFV
jgi:hypothetical protein